MRDGFIEVYTSWGLRGKQWYWRAISGNGNQTADGSEGYKNRQGVYKGIAATHEAFGGEGTPVIYQGGVRMGLDGNPYRRADDSNA